MVSFVFCGPPLSAQAHLTWDGNTLSTLTASVHRAEHTQLLTRKIVQGKGWDTGQSRGDGGGEGVSGKTGKFFHTERSCLRGGAGARAGEDRQGGCGKRRKAGPPPPHQRRPRGQRRPALPLGPPELGSASLFPWPGPQPFPPCLRE